MVLKTKFEYIPLLIFQFILVILYLVFVRYPSPEEDVYKGISNEGFENTHVMIFIGFGFLMTFLKKYGYSAVGYNLLLAALVVQWALFCQNILETKGQTIFITKKLLLEADIMCATILITFGALLGITSASQMLFIVIIETVIACCNFYLATEIMKAADLGGSIVIHTFGAYFGLGASFGLRSKVVGNSEGAAGNTTTSKYGPSYVSDIFAMIGTVFLWIFWPSFNSALAGSNSEYVRAVVNTYLSLAACTVSSFVFSAIFSHHQNKFDMVHIQNSTLAGGVAVGAIANMMIGPGVAILIGMIAGLLSVAGYQFLTPKLASLGIHDTCGVNNLHGMPGVMSGLLSVLFAMLATKEGYGDDLNTVFEAVKDGRSATNQGLMQLAALAATLVIALVTGVLTGLAAKTKIFSPLSGEEEKFEDDVNWIIPK